ncbi:MAG: hypothetical protein D6790_10665 [Caldilineae bacterium]|nr:MAG: hypothetical protein D6790_10665 [Caldilineae bacterium]
MDAWHLLYVKPHKEPQVNRLLQDRGVETFFPIVQIERGYGRGIRIEPFFPHYLFFRADLETPEGAAVRWQPGVRTIVHFGGRPAVVPDEVIAHLQARFVPLQEQVLHPAEWIYKPGQRVEIKAGPFAGLEAIFHRAVKGKDRAVILLNCLGAWNRAEVPLQHIAPALSTGVEE